MGRRVVTFIRTVARRLWAAPTSALGALLIVAGAYGVRVQIVDGVLEAHGPALAWMLKHLVPLSGGATAMTLGHIVLARDAQSLDDTRAHERVHVRQCERWGPFFAPAYLAGSLLAVLRGRHYYFDNPFEREVPSSADGTTRRRSSDHRSRAELRGPW